MVRDFCLASDNTCGMCPESLAAIVAANEGIHPPYGDDAYTTEACEGFRALFGTPCEVFFVFNGTAANALALASMCHSYHSVICSETAHVETDECGAPEFFSHGTKLLLVPSHQGKITPGDVATLIHKRHDIHYPKPRVVSITQATELGTVYSPDEIATISALAHEHGLYVHMDGARLANAVAFLDIDIAATTWKVGVDVLSFGGTKNGIGMSDVVIFFNHTLATDFDYRCKQAGQLASKMRFLAAPWAASLKSGSWLANARHANACARRLSDRLRSIPGVSLLYPTQANEVFVSLPESANAQLVERGVAFYRFIGGGSRFVCSWNTTSSTIDELVRQVTEAVAKP